MPTSSSPGTSASDSSASAPACDRSPSAIKPVPHRTPLHFGFALAAAVAMGSTLGGKAGADGPARAGVARTSYSPDSLAYVLQAENLGNSRAKVIETLTGCGRDLIIMDATVYGDPTSRWTPGELERIRGGKAGRRIVAYFSVGEAEDYRSYWKPEWTTTPPAFLLGENPDWEGNFRVKYWTEEWQSIILKQCDHLIAQGFDGVYLDIIDAFEGFEYDSKRDEYTDHKVNPETGKSYREDMVEWVGTIAAHAREKRPDFLVYPQNGEQLLANAGYRATVDGIGVEDLFSNGKKAGRDGASDFRTDFLDRLKADGKPILCVDYSTKDAIKSVVRRKAAAKGYVLIITDRDLETLGESGAAP